MNNLLFAAVITICALPIFGFIWWQTRNMAAGADVEYDGPVFTNTNPYRTGGYVYVMESNDRSDMDWYGTVIGMNEGMVMVRDDDTLVVAHVNKDQVFGVRV